MGNLFVDAEGTHPQNDNGWPLTAPSLAAHVHDLLEARGQQPILTPESRHHAEHAAAMLLAAYGVPDPRLVGPPEQPA